MSERALHSGKWKKLRITVLDRDGWICAICGGVADTVDHIYPRIKGGDMWALDNLQSLCKKDNSRKGGRFFSHKATPPVFSGNMYPMQSEVHRDSPFTARPVTDSPD